MSQLLTSRNNPLVKELAALAKEPSAEGALAEGIHLCREAFASSVAVRRLICTEQAVAGAEGADILAQAENAGCSVIQMTPECYEKISRLQSPEGIAVEFLPRPVTLAQVLSGACKVVVAAGMQDPGNAGALVRVAEAAGAEACIFVGGVDPYGGKFYRATMGSAFRLPCVRCAMPEFLSAARSVGVRLIVAQVRPGAAAYDALSYRPPVALCVGAEGTGIPAELAAAAEAAVYLPMAGRVESLNVSVAAGILLYQARRDW